LVATLYLQESRSEVLSNIDRIIIKHPFIKVEMFRKSIVFIFLFFSVLSNYSQETQKASIISITDEMQIDINEHLDSALIWPSSLKRGDISFITYISLVFDQGGKVESIDIERTPGEPFSKEALLACEAMRSWDFSSQILDNDPSEKYKIIFPVTFKPN
jgi:hypothetical protein